MLCGVTATLGSNPSATATAARPQWGRAVLLCLDGVWARVLGPGCLVCLARPGCLVCPWAAARPRAVRAASFARCVVSKPGQAPPRPRAPQPGPPDLPHRRRLCRCVWLGASSRSPARPRSAHGHRSLALRTFHTGGACVAVRGWVRRLEAWPGLAAAHGHRRPRVPQPGPAGLAVPSMLVVQTPFGGGEITVRGGVMPKVQTTSAKNAENGLLWAKWSAFWARRYLS